MIHKEGYYSEMDSLIGERVQIFGRLDSLMDKSVDVVDSLSPVTEQRHTEIVSPIIEPAQPDTVSQNPLFTDNQNQPRTIDISKLAEFVPNTTEIQEVQNDLPIPSANRTLVPETPVNTDTTYPTLAQISAAASSLASDTISQRAYLDELQKAVN